MTDRGRLTLEASSGELPTYSLTTDHPFLSPDSTVNSPRRNRTPHPMNATCTSSANNDAPYAHTCAPPARGHHPRALYATHGNAVRLRPAPRFSVRTAPSRMINLRKRTRANDRGAETLELVILTPFVLLLIGTIIVGGMITMAHQKVEHAAAGASRAASLARTMSQASTRAHEAASSDLLGKGLHCVNLSINTDTSGFRTRPGVTAAVRTTVTCDVALSSLGLIGISGVRTIRHTSSSPIDTYRERVR